MNIGEVREALFLGLRPAIEQAGFTRKGRHGEILLRHRADDGWLEGFHFTVVRHSSRFAVSPSLGVRIDSIQAALDSALGIRTKGVHWTLFSQYHQLGFGDRIGEIFDAETLRVSTQQLVESFTTIALPYFAAVGSPAAADATLNRSPGELSVLQIDPLVRALAGVAVAAWSGGDPENVAQDYLGGGLLGSQAACNFREHHPRFAALERSE